MASFHTPVTSCGYCETKRPSGAPHAFPKPSPFALCSLPFMTLLIQLPDIVLKMFALSIWKQNELPTEIIGSLQHISEHSVTVFTFICFKRNRNLPSTANFDFERTCRFTHLKHRVRKTIRKNRST